MHWGEEYLSGCSSTGTPLAGINALTTPAYCPDFEAARAQAHAGEDPQGRAAVVAAGHGLAARRDAASAAQQALQAADGDVSVCHLRAVLGQHARAKSAAASSFAPPRTTRRTTALIDRIEGLLGLGSKRCPALRRPPPRPAPRRTAGAPRRRQRRARSFPAGRRHHRRGLDRHPAARGTAGPNLRPAAAVAGRPRAGGACSPAGKPVCTCFNVTDLAIQA